MNKAQALHSFWSSFKVGNKPVPAYDESTVPSDAGFPRITYEVVEDSIGQEVVMTASIWDRNMSWVRSEEIAEDISVLVGMGGLNVSYTDGSLWLKRGTPFAQRMSDTDDSIRRIVINIEAEYIGG